MHNESNSKTLQDKLTADEQKNEIGYSDVTRKHGGDLGELIMPEHVIPMYDTECKHSNKSLDNSGEFDEVTCDDCPMVWVFDKGTFVV